MRIEYYDGHVTEIPDYEAEPKSWINDMIVIVEEGTMTERKKKYYTPATYKAAKKYIGNNTMQIAIRLNKKYDADLIETYQSIPNKAEWLKQCLREYREGQK